MATKLIKSVDKWDDEFENLFALREKMEMARQMSQRMAMSPMGPNRQIMPLKRPQIPQLGGNNAAT